MTPRQRLLTVLKGQIPDCVPCSPDFSNMIPCRLTGKPFWDIYLYNDPPLHEAYIAAAKHFDIDSMMECTFPLAFPGMPPVEPWLRREPIDAPWQSYIVRRDEDRIYVRDSYVDGGRRHWAPTMCIYYRDNPFTYDEPAEKLGFGDSHDRFEPVEGAKPVDTGPTGLARAKEMMGQQGLVGVGMIGTGALDKEHHIYYVYDHMDMIDEWARQRVELAQRQFAYIMSLPVKPDYLQVGGSGSLVFQTLDILKRLSFPAVKRIIELATAAGIPTHVHCCGPERELIKLMAEETTLTSIEPLEFPPAGDCNLAEIKRLYGSKLVLKGNLHTTNVMLRGSVKDVIEASKRAIDDAAEGGRFILSTGDQCGRDTPDQNIRAMVETARTYGRYT